MKQIIIFDYDGTLHETMRIYKPAIAEVVRWLRTECGVQAEQPSDARISSWLGMNTADMWRDFMPELEDDLKRRAGRRVGDHMLANLQSGMGRWYAGVEEMLDALCAAGYTPAVLSNCGNSYAQAHWDTFHMERWFAAFFACETWSGAPKSDIMRALAADFAGALKRAPVRRADAAGRTWSAAGEEYRICAVVGDRDSDLAGAQAAGVPFIGCLYGYGSREELSCGTALVRTPAEVVEEIAKRQFSTNCGK